MKYFKLGSKALFFWLLAAVCWAEVSPISLTLFGVYGQPVYPPVLANAAPNAFGLNILAEWNATSFMSFGFGFEQTTFYKAPDFTTPMVNFEGRLFPMDNERGKYSPYVYAGVGLNLAAASTWQGPIQLKAGIGSRVALIGPLFFDVAVGSHWLQPPNAFQYVDIRSGLSLSFGFKEKSSSESKPAEKPAEKPVAHAVPASIATSSPTFTPTVTPVGTPHLNWTPIPTPIIEIPAAPVTTLAGVKKYYKLGMKAFLDRNYPLSFKLLKKSLASKEIHGAAYYYAETYATIGVIYQFHAPKIKDHDEKALQNYKKALAIDPRTKSAKAYYKKLKAKLAKKKKPKAKAKPAKASSVMSVDNTATDSGAPVSSEKPTGNSPASVETPTTKGN